MQCVDQIATLRIDLTRMECKAVMSDEESNAVNSIDLTRMECKVIYTPPNPNA